MAVTQFTPRNEAVGRNLAQFQKELDAKLAKVRGKDSAAAMKALTISRELLADYESMGVELSAVDATGKVFDIYDFAVGGESQVVWQWLARSY